MSLCDLRLGTSPVKLIGINAPFEPAFQFGREYAAANARRESAASAWGFEHNGRPLEEGSIKQPLPVREQSTLSHRLTRNCKINCGGRCPFKIKAGKPTGRNWNRFMLAKRSGTNPKSKPFRL